MTGGFNSRRSLLKKEGKMSVFRTIVTLDKNGFAKIVHNLNTIRILVDARYYDTNEPVLCAVNFLCGENEITIVSREDANKKLKITIAY